MEVRVYNIIIWILILSTGWAYGQNQTKKVEESFKVNKNVLVEVNTQKSDITVEIWNKNMVSVEGTIEIQGVSQKEASKYFKAWDFEALGNKNKVVITSKASMDYFTHLAVFDDMNFDFDFDSISYEGDIFDGDYFSELQPLNQNITMPPMPPMPAMPADVAESFSKIEFDYNAYLEDKEAYMEKFKKKQKQWEKEYEEKMKPQLKAYEEQIKQWEKEVAPQMKAYEKQIEAHSKEIEEKMRMIEKDMSKKYQKKMLENHEKVPNISNVKTKFLIKVPKYAVLKINNHHGTTTIPDELRTLNKH